MALTLGSNGQLLVTPEKTAQEKLLQEWSKEIAAMPPKNPPAGMWTSVGYVNPATGENYSQGTGPVPVENELPNLYPDGNPGQGRWTPSGWNPNAPAVTKEEVALLNDPVADQERNRKSERDRMMQQYASEEYWDTEAGKAKLALGDQERYEGDDLAGFYEAQQAVGTGGIDEIIGGLGYEGDMEKWARANPALALREYQKQFPKGYAGYGTAEPQVDERLKDVTNQFLQQRVDQLKERQYPERDEPLWPGPEDTVEPRTLPQGQVPRLPNFSDAGQLGQLIESLGGSEVLGQIDRTGGNLAEQAGEWYGREKAKEMPLGDWGWVGDWMQNEGGRRGAEKGREFWNQYTGPFLQQN